MSEVSPAAAMSAVLVDELTRAGVVHAVVSPGSRSAPLALALERHPGVRVHVSIDERSAAFFALGIGKASGAPAVVVTTSGTAAANLHPAVLEAHHSRTPLLLLTSDRPPELRHTGANQTVDQLKLFGDAVRWFVEVGAPTDPATEVRYWRSLAAQAVARATTGPRGPVHLNLPLREPLVADQSPGDFALGARDDRPWTAAPDGLRAAQGELLDALTERVAAAQRPLLVLGDREVDPDAVTAFARAWSCPVVAEPLSGARGATNVVATASTLLAVGDFARAHVPDLVIRVGRAVLSRPVLALLDATGGQVVLDADGWWLDPDRASSAVIAVDPDAMLLALAGDREAAAGSSWLASWADADATARTAIDAVLDAATAPTEPRTARDLAAAVPDGATLVVASSMPVRDLDLCMAPRAGVRVLANRGGSGIDGFVSTTLGAAAVADGPVVALAGDLSLLHDQNGLLVSPRPDALFVVLNNGGGGIFSFLPPAETEPFERLFVTPHGLDLEQLARLHRCGYARLERADALAGTVADAVAAGGVQLIEVRTDRDANVALHRRLVDDVGSRLGA